MEVILLSLPKSQLIYVSKRDPGEQKICMHIHCESIVATIYEDFSASVGCNYLSLIELPAFGAKIFIQHTHYFMLFTVQHYHRGQFNTNLAQIVVSKESIKESVKSHWANITYSAWQCTRLAPRYNMFWSSMAPFYPYLLRLFTAHCSISLLYVLRYDF